MAYRSDQIYRVAWLNRVCGGGRININYEGTGWDNDHGKE